MAGDGKPYSESPEWKDVTPVPQDDGPEPLAVISYPPGFQEVHGYFRAIQQKSEFSERALALTADVIEHNSANYTAWWYRRRCLKELASDLDKEHIFTDKWARDCPKNYQVWYHRRWLITEMAAQIRKKASGGSSEEVEKEVMALAKRELEYHNDCMQVNDDYKNYNGWSHRQFILQQFGLWHEELKFVEELLSDDIRNNSAWNHRHTVVRKQCWPLTDDVRQREVDFAMNKIRTCANNECAWNYLSAFLGQEEGKVPWNSLPKVRQLCDEVVEAASGKNQICRFANEALAKFYEAEGNVVAAVAQYEILQEADKIRSKYWQWKVEYLRKKTSVVE